MTEHYLLNSVFIKVTFFFPPQSQLGAWTYGDRKPVDLKQWKWHTVTVSSQPVIQTRFSTVRKVRESIAEVEV